jgi:ABC-type multidrug transport system ATPase subunit
MAPVIEALSLSKEYKALKAVDQLSFTVNQGDVYGFLGQNGAGKSTTIRMLLTLVRPTAGEIFFFGKKLSAHRSETLKRVGAVIERPDLYKYLSAYENLSIFAKMSGAKTNRADILKQLKLVGLEERANDKVHTFSQGMKQRLGIAVALVHNPDIIILDEPTNGLDPQGIADIRNLIKKLSSEMGKTVMISSHLLGEVEQVANRMLIIHKGKKIVEGKVDELLDPAHTVVDIETTDDNAARQMLMNTKWATYLQPQKNFQFMMDKKEVPLLVQDIVSLGINLLSVNSSHSLENYFISLTTRPADADLAAN